MPTELKMPALSPTMEEGTLAKWLVKEGDTVASGDILAEIETDKATMEFEAVDEGTISKILVAEGSDGVKVGTVIALMGGEGEAAASPAQTKIDEPASQQTEPTPPAPAKPDPIEVAKPAPKAPDVPAGSTTSTTVREALRDAMAEEMRRDERVFVMGEEVAQYQGAYKVTQGLLDEFGPRRVIDTPITEYGFAGLGTGAAMGGLKPIVEFMTFNFAMQAIDHIINSAAKTNYMSGGQMRCPIVFRGPNGSASRVGAQHSQNYAPWYASVPGLVVIAPYDAADAKGLLKAAIRDPDPVMFFEHKKTYRLFKAEVPDGDTVVPIGRASVARAGKHLSIFCYGFMRTCALEAAETLAREDGVEVEVVDLRTLRPLDLETILASVAKTGKALVVHEANRFGGFGAEIAAEISERAFEQLDGPVTRLAGPDVPGVPYHHALEDWYMIGPARIVDAARKLAAY